MGGEGGVGGEGGMGAEDEWVWWDLGVRGMVYGVWDEKMGVKEESV